MFDKRLIRMVPGVMRYIVASVVGKWVALLCNIGVFAGVATLLAATVLGDVAPTSAQPAAAAAFGTVQAVVGALQAVGIGAPQAAGVGTLQAAPAWLLFFAILLAVRALAIYAAQRAGDRAAYLAKRRVRQAVYDKLTSMGPAYAEQVSTAEAVQTSVEGAQQLEVYFGGYLPQLFYAVLAPLTLFAALVGMAGAPAAVLLVIVPLIPISIMLVMRNAKKVAAEYWGSYVDLGGSFLEAVQGLTTLKIYRADERWHERMNREAEGFRRATMKMLGVQLRSINVMDLVAFGGAAAGIIVALLQLNGGAIGFFAAFMVVFLSQEFFLPMRRLGSLFHTAMNGMSAAKTMFRILDVPEPARGEAELNGGGDVVCSGVGYAYGDTTVLADVSCTVARGSLTAIVGGSGSGKSTLAGILSGRKAGYQGRLTIGGVDVRDASLASLSRTVTLVPTNGHLFEGTVRSNLTMAAPNAADEELWEALRRCQVDGFVRAAGGLDARVAEGGSNLSGGQRQRICVARALLHDTPIYVFDEATSNVDAASERAIGQVIAGLAGTHTVIVIAHRLASVVEADQILVVDGGALVERGSHAELVAARGRYTELWESQHELAAFTDKAVEGTEPEVGAATDVRVSAVAHAMSAGAASADVEPSGAGDASAVSDRPHGATALAADAHVGAPAAPAHRSAFSIMMRMVGLVRPLMPYLLLAIALGSLGSLAATFVTTFGAYGIMAALDYPLALGVGGACALAAVCAAVRGPLHYGEQLCNHYIAFRLLALIRDRVFSALRRLAPAKLEGRDKGDLVSLVTADIELLEVFYAHTISPIAIALVTSLVMLVFIGVQAPALAVIALVGYVLLGVVMPVVSSKLCGDAGRASRDGAGAISAYVLDSLRGLAEVIQLGRTSERARGLAQRTDAMGRSDRRLHVRMALVEGLADAVVLGMSLAMVAASIALAAAGELALPTAFVCAFAYLSSFGPVLAVCRLGTSLQATLASGARVLDLLDEQPACAEVTAGEDIAFAGAAAEHVSFSYGAPSAGGAMPAARPVPAAEVSPAGLRAAPAEAAPAGLGSAPAGVEAILDDVSVAFAEGEMVCITGRSGSGKSTLLKLLMRFWDATAGRVEVSGVDVRGINTASLRAAESYMTQDTHLFVGTIGNNLRIARADATDAELDAACEAAALTELIERLPAGYDTPVGELGDSLSGGERQRIGLARVFLHDAPFVLLDEPTSNLDALSEAAVMRSVARLRAQGKTVVLVSHRASTCAFADRSYSVERGRLS